MNSPPCIEMVTLRNIIHAIFSQEPFEEHMELQEFITDTLLEISNGLRQANNISLGEKATDPNASRTFFLRPGTNTENGAGIEFDVAVTTTKSGEGKTGATLKLSVVEAELGGSGGISKECISRINFTINVGQWVG